MNQRRSPLILSILLLLISGTAFAQTLTTLTGTIKDLTGATVTSGRIQFTLNAPDATAPSVGRFVPSTVYCQISSAGHPVSNTDGVSACTITSNTAISPSGTSYATCIQPYFVQPGGCFGFYALAGQTIDLSTIAPTPTTLPLNYGGTSSITGLITQGANVTITGSGTNGSPYVVNATGAGGGTIAHTTVVLKGDNAGNAVAAASGTDYVVPSGNVATATALAGTPTLCPTGQAPVGITAAGNATGCAVIGGGGISALTGPVTASGTGSVPSTITPTGVTAGSYTNLNATINAAGQVTSAANGAGGGGGGSATAVFVSAQCTGTQADLNTGLTPAGGAATDYASCVNGLWSGSTAPMDVYVDVAAKVSGLHVRPGVNLIGVGKGGIARINITAWSISSNVVTFTTQPQTLAVNNSVQLGQFVTGTFFNAQWVKVLSATSTSFTAAFTHSNGSSTEAGEGDFLYGNGFVAAPGTNNDLINNVSSGAAGGCVNGYSDLGWAGAQQGIYPQLTSGYGFYGLVLNGFGLNNAGGNGNSTSGQRQGTGTFTNVYGGAYCSYMGVNLLDAQNIVFDGVTIYNSPAYVIRLSNTKESTIRNSNLFFQFPNQPVPTGGQNGDGIHYSGPTTNCYVDSTTILAWDDAIAYNAPEGRVGAINHCRVTNSSFTTSVNGVRAYTASIAPPSGDVVPTISDVELTHFGGRATQAAALIGLFVGSRTFTVQNSITGFHWHDSEITSDGYGFLQDDTIGTINLNHLNLSMGCNAGAGGFYQGDVNLESVTLLDLSDSHVIRSPSRTCAGSAVDSATGMFGRAAGSLLIGTLDTNGFGAYNVGVSTGPMAQLLNLSTDSTVGNWNPGVVDYTNITKAQTGGTISNPQTVFDAGIGTGSNTTALTLTGSNASNTGFTFQNRTNGAFWQHFVTGSAGPSAPVYCIYTANAGGLFPECLNNSGISLGSTYALQWSNAAPGATTTTDLALMRAGVRLLAIGGSATTPGTLQLGQPSWNTAYNILNLNGVNTAAGNMGITGGGPSDPNVYHNVPPSGHFYFLVGGTTVAGISPTGQVSGNSLLLSGTDPTASSMTYSGASFVPGSSTTLVAGPGAAGQFMVSEGGASLSRVCTGGNSACAVAGVANITITVPNDTAFAAYSCSTYTGTSGSYSSTTMVGLTSGMTVTHTATTHTETVVGWGATVNGHLRFIPTPTAGVLQDSVCNDTGSIITTGSAVTFNVSAK